MAASGSTSRTTNRKKTPAASRTAASQPAAPEAEVSSDVPVLRLTRSTEPQERVLLFSIDDIEFTVPKKPGANIALGYLKTVRTSGKDAGYIYLLEKMLGTEAFEALTEFGELTAAELAQIIAMVRTLALGPKEKTSPA